MQIHPEPRRDMRPWEHELRPSSRMRHGRAPPLASPNPAPASHTNPHDLLGWPCHHRHRGGGSGRPVARFAGGVVRRRANWRGLQAWWCWDIVEDEMDKREGRKKKKKTVRWVPLVSRSSHFCCPYTQKKMDWSHLMPAQPNRKWIHPRLTNLRHAHLISPCLSTNCYLIKPVEGSTNKNLTKRNLFLETLDNRWLLLLRL